MNRLRLINLGVLLLIGGCVAPVLLLPSSGQIIWGLVKPLVGFDPNTVNLWEQPVIKNRMTAFLGDRYQPVMQLIRTANELQQEGPLFYVVSRYTPVPEIADKAGLVWNKDTNQFAALLNKDGVSQILTEKLQTAVENRATAQVQKRLPAWPAELAPLAALAVPFAPEALQQPAQVLLQTPAPAAAVPAPAAVPTEPAVPAPTASTPPAPAPTRAPIIGPSSPLPAQVPP